MNTATLTKVASLLREKKAEGSVSAIAKGLGGLVKDIAGSATGASAAAGKALTAGGHGALGTAVKYLPHAAAAYGAKKVYDSEPVQRQIYNYRVRKAQRAQEHG